MDATTDAPRAAVFLLLPVQEHPSFSSKAKTQRCLKYSGCKYLEFRNQDRTVDSSNSLQIFHQNSRGLRSKTDELVNSLETDNINPHILCVSEHHTETQDLLFPTLTGYPSRSSFCWQTCQKGDVCFLFVKTCISAKLIFHLTVKKGI